MNTKKNDARVQLAGCLLALISLNSLSGTASAQAAGAVRQPPPQQMGQPDAQAGGASVSRQEAAAIKHVTDAVGVVQRMVQEPRMKQLLQQAKGVFIVPTYGRAAIGVGASGGSGVLVVKRPDGTWSDPLFYNLGGLSAGAQVGAEAGAMALVLNNDKAVNKFMQKNAFSLNADSGLTVVNWAKMAQGTAGSGDVVAWAGTKGLYGNLVTVGVNDIRFNQNLTTAFYHQPVTATEVLNGKVSNPHSDQLKQALAAATR